MAIASARATSEGPSSNTITTPIPSEAQPVAELSPVEARSASVRVHFQSEIEASVIVWVDRQRVINKNLFGGGGGLFGHKNNQEGYNYSETIDVPAGAKVALHVIPRGKKSIVRNFEAKGGPQRLEAYLSKDEHLTAQLN